MTDVPAQSEPVHAPAPARSGPAAAERITVSARTARALTAELDRRRTRTNGLVVGVEAGSAVLSAAVETLKPGDALTVVPRPGADLRPHIAKLRDWAAERIRVVDELADAKPADVVVVAEPLTGTAEQARAALSELGTYVVAGGVLVAAAVVAPWQAGGAAAELDRQGAIFGVGTDLVLRNTPPVRVYRLSYSAADPAAAEELAPADRTSSVPLTRDLHIDSNGVAAAGIALGLAALARLSRPRSKMWLAPAVAALPVAAFFRDPERDIPVDEDAVVAASDGKVLSVERLRDPRLSNEDMLRIAVFLSVLDVHVNRAPVAGRVADFFATDGGFAAAMKPAAEHNVAAYTVLDTAHGQVVVAQRTGLIARRIVQRAPVGALLARGERFGLIRFGSRTDVYLPAAQAQAVVTPGDRVYGGSTIIARWI